MGTESFFIIHKTVIHSVWNLLFVFIYISLWIFPKYIEFNNFDNFLELKVECHPYLNQKQLKEFCENKGILITAYSPLGSPDRPWASKDDPQLLSDPKIVEIAEKYNKSPGQIAIKYQVTFYFHFNLSEFR